MSQTTTWPLKKPRKNNRRFDKVKGCSSWFEIYKLNHKTYAFLESNHIEEVISYLIIGSSKAILFDSGMGIANIKKEISLLTGLPVVVINSHGHYDHIGGNYQYDEIWCYNNEFEISRITTGYSQKECKDFMKENMYFGLPGTFDFEQYSIRGSKISRYLEHNDKIEIGNRVLTVYSTPGETPGAISLFDESTGFLFCGDLIYPGQIWLHLKESNWESFIKSLEFLHDKLNPDVKICPAHNEVCVSYKFLKEIINGVDDIENHKIKGRMIANNTLFEFNRFSILKSSAN